LRSHLLLLRGHRLLLRLQLGNLLRLGLVLGLVTRHGGAGGVRRGANGRCAKQRWSAPHNHRTTHHWSEHLCSPSR
jgi:hypothetical protein